MGRGMVTEQAPDGGAERALAELRDGIDLLERQHDAQRPDKGVGM